MLSKCMHGSPCIMHYALCMAVHASITLISQHGLSSHYYCMCYYVISVMHYISNASAIHHSSAGYARQTVDVQSVSVSLHLVVYFLLQDISFSPYILHVEHSTCAQQSWQGRAVAEKSSGQDIQEVYGEDAPLVAHLKQPAWEDAAATCPKPVAPVVVKPLRLGYTAFDPRRTAASRYSQHGAPEDTSKRHGELAPPLVQEAAVVVQEAAVVVQKAAAVEHEAAVVEHEAAVVVPEAAVAEHEPAVVEQEVAVVEQEAAVVEHEAAVVVLEEAVVEHEEAVAVAADVVVASAAPEGESVVQQPQLEQQAVPDLATAGRVVQEEADEPEDMVVVMGQQQAVSATSASAANETSVQQLHFTNEEDGVGYPAAFETIVQLLPVSDQDQEEAEKVLLNSEALDTTVEQLPVTNQDQEQEGEVVVNVPIGPVADEQQQQVVPLAPEEAVLVLSASHHQGNEEAAGVATESASSVIEYVASTVENDEGAVAATCEDQVDNDEGAVAATCEDQVGQ
eukprot:jgi/Chrzof1/13482/UNPLg00569.t1